MDVEVLPDEEVDKFDYDDAYGWLNKHSIESDHLTSLEEIIEKIKKTIADAKEQKDDTANQQESTKHGQKKVSKDSQRMMKEILSRDYAMKNQLAEVYVELEHFINDDIGEEQQNVINEKYPNYENTLSNYKGELVNDECPIVVAGETTAGKSSLLNLLLGSNVLPHSLLCATSTICRLHNCEKKRFEIHQKDQKPEVIDIDDDADGETLREKLKDYVVSTETNRKENVYKQVDIYWPIPMLQERVTIVDTPGIGESQEMTERLMDYLPNAVAFIYVINSSIAGGVQDDRLLHIINEQRKWEREGRLSTFDFSCTIFVCNKWDRVSESEEEKVWQDTIKKLKSALPDFPDDKVFKMSTTEAERYVKSGMGHTEKFQKLLDGIESMVPESLKAKVRRHFRWLEKFLNELQKIITSRISHARATEEEKQKLLNTVQQRISKLRLDSERVKRKLTEYSKTECIKLADKLHDYLYTKQVTERLLDWSEDEAPGREAGDFDVIKFCAEKTIRTKIQNEIKKWETETKATKDLSDRLRSIFIEECQLLGKACAELDLVIEGTEASCDFQTVINNEEASSSESHDSLFTKSEKAILAIAAPLWVPLVTAASILFLPVGVGMYIKETIRVRNQRTNYLENKLKYMQKWTNEIVKVALTKENIETFVLATYHGQFCMKIHSLCTDFIPQQINADIKQVQNIHDDKRSSREIIEYFTPLQRKLKGVLGKYQLFGLQYMATDLVDSKKLHEKKKLGKGSYSDVFLVEWEREEGNLQVALKILRRTLKGTDIYSQLMEVDILRKLQHPNIVEFYGVSIDIDNGNRDTEDTEIPVIEWNNSSLMLLLEYCDNDLETMVFDDNKLQCREYMNVVKRKEAFRFYVTMVMGICDGLNYIHSKRILHRDLKLSNVLVKGNVAKICDLGFARHELATTGTMIGTYSHMSPEMLSGKSYTESTDIHSLGILLWEFWYGRNAYSESEYANYATPQLLDFIKSGSTPRLDLTSPNYRYSMMKELQTLLTDCWKKEPTERPKATDVSQRLKDMYKELYQEDVV